MGQGFTVALATAAMLLVLLPMLLVSLPAADPYELETRRMFVDWKARMMKSYKGEPTMMKSCYKYAGEGECRYAVFKETRRRVDLDRATGITSSGLNGFAATTHEEFHLMFGQSAEEQSYEEETRGVFLGWKAQYGKTYRDANDVECRYRLFKGNGRVVVRLNVAAGLNVYSLNQFGDLTKEEVQERCYPVMEDRELSARCQAAIPDPEPVPDPSPDLDPDRVHRRRIQLQINRKRRLLQNEIDRKVCQCIAMELKQTESGGIDILGDEAHMSI